MAAASADGRAAHGLLYRNISLQCVWASALHELLPASKIEAGKFVLLQMVARGGIEEMCSLLLLVAQEEAERIHSEAASESPEAPGDQQASNRSLSFIG